MYVINYKIYILEQDQRRNFFLQTYMRTSPKSAKLHA